MATGGSPSGSAATGPTQTSDEAAPFSDDTVRLFQLVCIYVKLVPGILHELFKHHYKDSWEVEWDDSVEKRTKLAAEMENEEVKPEFCYDEVTEKSITMWDVTTSCAALKVVWMFRLPQYITDVRDARNSLFHLAETEVQLGSFNEIKDFVQKLIYGAGLNLPRETCDVYQKELDTLASSETFRKKFTNVKDVAELQEMLKRIMEDVRKQGEQGEVFSAMIEALTSKLQDHLEFLRRDLAGIQQGQEVIKHGQEVIKHGQEVIQCKQDQHQVVTEQVLAVLQGLGPGQEYISRQLEPRETNELLSQDRHRQASDHKGKSPKRSRQSGQMQQKRGSTSCGSPADQLQQSVTDAAGSQEPPSSSDQKGKSSPSQPSAKRSKQSVTDAAATQKLSSSSDQKGKSPKRSRQPVTDAAAFQEPPSSTMRLWKKEALKFMRQELGRVKMNVVMIKKLEKSDIPSPDNIGFLSHEQLQEVESERTPTGQMNKVIDILLEMEDKYFENFCQILKESNFEGKAIELRNRAEKEYERYVGAGQTCGQTSSQAGAQDDTAVLGWKPSLLLLQRSVVPRVSANWKAVGLNLDIKGSCLSAIEKSKPHQPDACCTEMFSMWLGRAPHTGGLPLTWSSVLSAVGKVDGATSEELLAELKSRAKAHPVTLKLAGELEAYYNRLEPVVGVTPKSEFVELAVVEWQKKEGLWKKKNFEEFLHATVNGIDEIYEKSYPVEYCQILTLEKGPTTGKHIIVSGAPGSGKTTLVRQLCKDLSSGRLRSGYTLVVLVELRELILLLQDKEEAQLHHLFTKFKRRIDIDQVCRELEESDGRSVLLVLDGFDELDARMRGCQLLKKLLSTESIYLPDCDILVTSRPVTCPDLLGLMQPLHRHIEILGFSEDRIASFIRSYFKCTCQPPPSQPAPSQMSAEGGCEAEKLLSRLAQLPQVKGMCRTPVVLKVVCEVCQILGADDLPATMAGIYEAFICRQLLENGPQDTVISSILQVPSTDYPFFSDLCRIAFECCTKEKLTISREDIGSTPPPFTKGTIYGLLFEDRVADLRAIRGLALYHFMHKTVQEALAACHLAALPDPKSHEEVWRKWLGRPEMAEVWKFYSGFTGLECVDISSIVPLTDKADKAVRILLMISLFEAGNASLAREELPRIFPCRLGVVLRTSYETAAYAFALQHHPSLEWLGLSFFYTLSVNLQLLLDVISRHSTARELYVEYSGSVMVGNFVHVDVAKDHAALCQFLRGKHRLAKVELLTPPVEVGVAALSTESCTMEELEWTGDIPVDNDATGDLLLDCLRSTPLRCITIGQNVGEALLPILRGLAANTKTVDRTVVCWDDFPLDPSMLPQLAAELRQFLVPCVRCDLRMPLPVGVWGSLLSGVGDDARQLEQLRVVMFAQSEGAGLEWDHICQPILEEVKKSWARSRCGEVEINISGCSCDEAIGDWYRFPDIQGSTLDATMKLLYAVVRGIIQREDQFVFKLKVNDEQVSRLVELEDIAKNAKCAVTRTESVTDAKTCMTDVSMVYTNTVLELKPLSSDRKGKSSSSSSQPPAKRSRQRL